MDDIGDAIRSKLGESQKYYPAEMPEKIRSIPQEAGSVYSPGEGIDISNFVISVTQALRDTIAGKSTVSITPTQQRGTKVADFIIDGVAGSIYAPEAGAGSFADLSDVEISNLQNGQIPKYNAQSGKWENATDSGGASAVSDLTDVSLSNLADGEILKYNSTSLKWENKPDAGGTTLPFNVVINSTDNGIDLVYDDGT